MNTLWNRAYTLNILLMFLVSLVFYCLLAIAAPYTMDTFHVSAGEGGISTGMCLIGSVLLRPFAGRYLPFIGQKRMVIAGILTIVLSLVLYFFPFHLPFLWMARAVHGMGNALITTASATISAAVTPARRQSEGIGYWATSLSAAMAIGPFLSLYLYQTRGFPSILILCVILCAAALAAAFALPVPEAVLTAEEKETLRHLRLRELFEPRAVPMSLLSFLGIICYASLMSFIGLYVKDIGAPPWAASLFFLVYSCAIFLSRPFTGPWMDHGHETSVMASAFITMAGGLLLLGLSWDGLAVLGASFILGYGFGTFQSGSQALAVRGLPLALSGRGTATYLSCVEIGNAFGASTLGFFASFAGYRAMYLSLSVFSLVILLLYLHYFRKG